MPTPVVDFGIGGVAGKADRCSTAAAIVRQLQDAVARNLIAVARSAHTLADGNGMGSSSRGLNNPVEIRREENTLP